MLTIQWSMHIKFNTVVDSLFTWQVSWWELDANDDCYYYVADNMSINSVIILYTWFYLSWHRYVKDH